MGANSVTEISARPVPLEPMYIIVNLGLSESFGAIEYDKIPFPVHMYVDYIRVYQPKGKTNIGCDPKDMPTADYITKYASFRRYHLSAVLEA
jgi:beta-glucan synthesis-associated protein KRE6